MAFISGDPRQLANLDRVLRRTVGDVALLSSLAELQGLPGFDLIAVHYDTLSAAERERLTVEFSSRVEGPTLVLLSERYARQDFARLFGAHALTNMLVIRDSGVNDSDLLVTVQKIRLGDIFGLQKYFEWGVVPQKVLLRSSDDKNRALELISAYADRIGIRQRLRASISIAADEFLSNAIYNAPVAADGTHRFAPRPRTSPVELDPGEEVELQFCCDGRRFGLSVSDPFGSLTPSRIQDYLARGFRGGDGQFNEGPGGAGLGFFQILDSLSHFVVNLSPGRRTEMIGLVDVRGSYRDFAESGKSFNIFVRGEAS